MGKLKLTPRARADLDQIWFSIATGNVRAAEGVVRRILAKAQTAADFPYIGPLRPDLSPTARILVIGPYVVIYEPKPDGILVIGVVHGRRDPQRWLT